MKKQYVFIAMILIILYLAYLIISFSYREYKINSHINDIRELNSQIKTSIEKTTKEIEYKSTKAYKNKKIKENSLKKNIGENVIYITNEEEFKKYTEEPEISEIENIDENTTISLTDTMNIFQKWIYFLFEKDIR